MGLVAKRQRNTPPTKDGAGPSPSGTAPAAAGNDPTIPTEVAGKLIRVSAERVRQLTKLGWIKSAGRNRYRVIDVVHGYLDYRDDADRRAQKSASASRVQDMRARELEIRVAEKERELIPTEEAISFVGDALGKLRAGMIGLPARVSRDVTLRTKLEAEIDGEFERAAEAFRKESAALRSGGEPMDAAGEDDA